MSWNEIEIPLADSKHFETLNGLWKGKKEPFVEVGVIRNTNFIPSGVIDYSNVAYLDVEAKQLSKRRLEPGDIILERSGGGQSSLLVGSSTSNAMMAILVFPTSLQQCE